MVRKSISLKSCVTVEITILAGAWVNLAQGGAPAPPPRPANLFVLALDGKAPLPGATGN